MPMYTLHRTHVLRTKRGHAIGFEKDKPTHVPPECTEEAIAIGARPVEGDPDDVLGPEVKADPALTPEERKAKIFEAFETMSNRSERLDFGASGLPHVRRLSQLVGFDVDSTERDTLWREYSTREGNEV